jgi:hypothetical protein
VLPPVDQVSVMTSSQHVTEPQGTRAEGPDPPSGSKRFEFLKTIGERADPMQSETVKGWLRGDLRAPK